MDDHIKTHSPDCWSLGPRHYDCAARRVDELEAKLATAVGTLERALNPLEHIVKWSRVCVDDDLCIVTRAKPGSKGAFRAVVSLKELRAIVADAGRPVPEMLDEEPEETRSERRFRVMRQSESQMARLKERDAKKYAALKAKDPDFLKKQAEKRKSVRYSGDNLKKVKCRQETQNAIRNGLLVKQPCEVCGEVKVDAHHPDYDQPLLVKWLCPTHHARLHSDELWAKKLASIQERT